MLRISVVPIASFAVALVAAVALETHVARADWSAIGSDWDERAPVTKTTRYVCNDYGDSAVNVELRVTELDASGHRVETPSYQVPVTSFAFVELSN
jgi:hypothetical protein